MKEVSRKVFSQLMILVMVISTLYVPQSGGIVNATKNDLSNPRIVADSSMKAGQKVTWDVITFGSYPQSEVTSDDTVYDVLVAATEWDDNQEITIEGRKYRRMKKDDATYFPKYETPCYYQWENDSTYHYYVYEPIEWRVLHVEDDKALVLSELVLDNQELYSSSLASKWEKSQVRSWLNGYGADVNTGAIDYADNNFIDFAFTEEEQATIIQYTEDEIEDAYVGSGMEDDTTDKLFLLSATEVYLNEEAASYGFVRNKDVYDEARWCHSSDYAKAQGIYNGDSTNYEDNCIWWLRASGSNFSKAGCVYDCGTVSSTSDYKNENVGIRVAFTLDLSKEILYAYKGTVCSDQYKIEVESSGEKIEGELCAPRIDADKGMNTERKTTWDCVWFGSYPQTEITNEDEIYAQLASADGWDEYGDITIDGTRYRRILKGDSRATSYNATNPDSKTSYYWEDDTTYHYFRYDPIKWRVLNVDSNQAYLVSDKVLDYNIFGGTTYDNSWWKTSCIRSWLNGYSASSNSDKVDYTNNSFVKFAFADYEEEAIVTSTIPEGTHLYYGTSNGDDVTSTIHMLSESEVCGMQLAKTYGFGAAFEVEDESRSAMCTTYAKAMGVVSEESGKSNYWLRSTPNSGSIVIQVEASGSVDNRGVSPKKFSGVRPTLYLNLNRKSAYAYAGEMCSDGTMSEEGYTGTLGEENGGLSNPVVSTDNSLKAGQKVTWDCITFGSYPQSEVTSEDAVYATLTSASGWNENGDVTIDGVSYRRMLAEDATYARTEDYTRGYYQWEDDATYHYFKYEPIKWRVLRVDNNQALLLSDIALDNKIFYRGVSCSWETSTIRNWLNGYDGVYVEKNFVDNAFSEEEQNVIIPYNESDACDGTEETNAITDKVFLLSTADISSSEKATKYGFVNGPIGVSGTVDEGRRCHCSDFAKANGAYSISSSVYENNCFWWTRNGSSTYGTITTVADNGCVTTSSCSKKNVAVRVALNLDLAATDLYSYVGTVSSTDNIKLIDTSDRKTEGELSSPVTVNDYSTISGKITTWDCVWYGKYPQSEITSDNSVYERLESATNWNEQEDVTIENKKYRRLLDGETYRYFKYEPIKWRVLQVDNKQMLLLADEALDVRGIDATYTTQAWDVSTMRSWLNGKDGTQNRDGIDFTNNSFIGTAFSEAEQSYIVKSKVDNTINMYNVEEEIDCGKNTLDHVFLLSDAQVYGTNVAEKYGFDGSFIVLDEARSCRGSEYVQAKGLKAYTVMGQPGYVEWWLRTQGASQREELFINSIGTIGGSISPCGVRPAMCVSLEENKLYSYAGTVCSDKTESEEGGSGSGEAGETPENSGDATGDESGSGEAGEPPENGGDATGDESGSGEAGETPENGGDATGDESSSGEAGENPENREDSTGDVNDSENEENTSKDDEDSTEEPGGMGGTTGEMDSSEEVITQKVNIAKVSSPVIVSYQYCGQALTPTITLTYNNSQLIFGKDYTVTYKNNINVGTAQIVIEGNGDYIGTKTVDFQITPFDASKLSTTLKGKDGNIYRAIYTKKAIKLKTAFRIATTNNGQNVYLQPKEGTDYTVRFENNKKIGTANIIYTFKGNYTGTLTKKFHIVPPTTKVTSVKKSGSKLVIKWKKISSCNRYELYRATSKNGKYKKIATIMGKNQCIYKDKKAKKGKKYYYKVKACKKVNGTIYKSDFSNVKRGKA